MEGHIFVESSYFGIRLWNQILFCIKIIEMVFEEDDDEYLGFELMNLWRTVDLFCEDHRWTYEDIQCFNKKMCCKWRYMVDNERCYQPLMRSSLCQTIISLQSGIFFHVICVCERESGWTLPSIFLFFCFF